MEPDELEGQKHGWVASLTALNGEQAVVEDDLMLALTKKIAQGMLQRGAAFFGLYELEVQ